MIKSFMKLFFVFFIGLIFLISCQKEDSITIGFIAPLKSQSGLLMSQAAEMAVEEINAQNGILGKKLQIVLFDDENKADSGSQNLKKLLDSQKIDFLMGGHASGVVFRQMEVMAEKKILWLSAGGAHTSIINNIKSNYNRYRYFFRVGVPDTIQQGLASAQMVEEVISKKFGLNQFAILATNLEYTKAMASILKKTLSKKNYKLVYERYFPASTIDFLNYFQNAKNNGAQFIISYTLGTEANTLIRQYHDNKISLPMIGTNAVSGRKEFWKETEGKCIYIPATFFVDENLAVTSKTMPFAQKFTQKFKTSPGFNSWGSYDSFYLLKRAAEMTNSLNTEDLIRALEKIDYEGTMRYKFTPFHDLTYGEVNGKLYWTPIFFQWKKDGKLHPVWPSKYADSEFEMPDWIKVK